MRGTGVILKDSLALTSITVNLPAIELLKGTVTATFRDGQSNGVGGEQAPLTLALQLDETSADCFHLNAIRLTGKNTNGSGQATFYSNPKSWEGKGELAIADLGAYRHWLSKDSAGSASVKAQKNTLGLAEFEAGFKNMRYGPFEARSVAVQGKSQENTQNTTQENAQGLHNLEITLQGEDSVVNGISLAKLSGSGIFGQNAGTFSLAGGNGNKISFKTKGEIGFPTPSRPETHITLSEAALHHPLHQLVLKQPVTVINKGEDVYVSKVALKIGSGLLTLDNVKVGDDLSGDLKIERLPLTILRVVDPGWIADGHLSGKGSLKGTKENPEAKLSLEGKSLHWKGPSQRRKSLPGINAGTDFSLAGGLLEWQTRVTCKHRVNITSAGKISVDKWLPDMESAGQATLKGQGDLDVISLFFDTEDLIRGQAVFNLAAEGTIASPQLKGSLSVKNGIYENAHFGTFIKNITIQGNSAGNILTFSHISGKDATKGEIKGEGRVNFSTLLAPEIDFRFGFTEMLMIQNDEITAKAGGNLAIKGTLGADDSNNEGDRPDSLSTARISGDIVLKPLEVRLDHHPSRVATIRLLEKKRNGDYETLAEHNQQEQAGQTSSPFDLDIKVSSSKDIYLRGYGLDSRWKGALHITGPVSETVAAGDIALVKGKFDLLGKPLKLAEGLISFSNDHKNDPLLTIVGAREIEDITAMMRVEGRASNPKITFASTPALPQEEVLARLIFGKGLESISVTQTLLLANALTSFKSNNDLNFTDKIRSAFGLDILEFKEKKLPEGEDSQQAGQMVSVGKRISDKVSISVDQSVTGDGGPTATVQYDMTRNFKIEAGVGGDSNCAGGFSWIKRY